MPRSWWAASAVVVFILTVCGLVAVVRYQPEITAASSGDATSWQQPTETLAAPPEPQALGLRTPAWSPWPAGTAISITSETPVPGQTIRVGQCTVAYSFSDLEGNAYAVPASHCGDGGDQVWGVDNELTGQFDRPVGHFIYSDLHAPDSSHLDMAIVAIDDPQAAMRTPDVEIPTALGVDAMALGNQLCKYGSTTGLTCGAPVFGTTREVLTDGEGLEVETLSAVAQVCARMGDSGGPVFVEEDGSSVLVGVVSGTRIETAPGEQESVPPPDANLSCDAPEAQSMTMSYATMSEIQRVVDRVIPNAAYL